MHGFGWHVVLSLDEVLSHGLDIHSCPEEYALLTQHQFKFVEASGSQSWDKQWLWLVLVKLWLVESLHGGWSNLFEELAGLAWQHTDEDYVTLAHDLLIIEFCYYSKLLLERFQQVWLSCGNPEFEIVKTTLDFKKFGKDHRAKLTTSDYTDFVRWHVIEQFSRAGGGWFLTLWIFTGFAFILCGLILLFEEHLLVENEVIEDGCVENTLEHDHIAHHFTSQEGVLQVNIWNEIVQPLFVKLWHTTHFKEIWRL